MLKTNKKNKRNLFIALLVCFIMFVATIFTIGSSAIVTKAASNSITVHFYNADDWDSAYVYYWNSKPKNVEVSWPGKKMNEDGNGWYSYTIDDVSKVNFLFSNKGENQTDDLTANKSGDWYYKNGKLTKKNPDASSGGDIATTGKALGGDFREDSIYFMITTRFYDGYAENNKHCWDNRFNEDDDPEWRGDFAGLIEKLDYIKALGFSAIWITPVVENGSGFDYHGYHAINFKKVDGRYESEGATYQDLIDAAHKKGIKIIQDIVLNHTCNFGEENIFPIFEKEDPSKTDGTLKSPALVRGGEFSPLLDEVSKKYFGVDTYEQTENMNGTNNMYNVRIKAFKNCMDQTNNVYHGDIQMQWEGYTVQTAQMHGDCVDLNTENPYVANYLREAYDKYINMGVDSFRIDTVKHISRLTMNNEYVPHFIETAKANGDDNFYMFGEVCAKYSQAWNSNNPNISGAFYTWNQSQTKKDSEYAWGDRETNEESTATFWNDNISTGTQCSSNNALLDGNNYHKVDYSKASGMGVIDFPMHWNFGNASDAFRVGYENDTIYNDATWNVVYVDSHDYSPDNTQTTRYPANEDSWAENLDLMFTFRGIPCIYYGTETMFKGGVTIDKGPELALCDSGRAYYGDALEGNVTATDYSEYTASGTVAETLNNPLAKHIQRLNKIRRTIPALQKGQYSREGCNGSAGMAFKRRYTDNDVDSFVCVTISGGATFTGVPNGTYVDAITGDKKTVNNGTLTTNDCSGKGNMRVYVLNNGDGISEAIGESGKYLQ